MLSNFIQSHETGIGLLQFKSSWVRERVPKLLGIMVFLVVSTTLETVSLLSLISINPSFSPS